MAVAETIAEHETIRADARNMENIDLKKAEMRRAKNLYHLVRRARVLDRDLARFSFRIQEIDSKLRPLTPAEPAWALESLYSLCAWGAGGCVGRASSGQPADFPQVARALAKPPRRSVAGGNL
jgi:hypothetical protein